MIAPVKLASARRGRFPAGDLFSALAAPAILASFIAIRQTEARCSVYYRADRKFERAGAFEQIPVICG
jgi:hypothetical protein